MRPSLAEHQTYGQSPSSSTLFSFGMQGPNSMAASVGAHRVILVTPIRFPGSCYRCLV